MQVIETPFAVCSICGTLRTDCTDSWPTVNPNSSVFVEIDASYPRIAQYTICPPAWTDAMVKSAWAGAVSPDLPIARAVTRIGWLTTCEARLTQISLSIAQLSFVV